MTLTAEKTEIPMIDAPVKECKICDLMIGLGIASAVCEDLPSGERGKCHQIMKPLEERKASVADVLADMIVLTGDTNLNAVLDRTNLLIYSAMTKAKEILIKQGKLTAEGFPVEAK